MAGRARPGAGRRRNGRGHGGSVERHRRSGAWHRRGDEVLGDVGGHAAQFVGHRVKLGPPPRGLPLHRLADRGGLAGCLVGHGGCVPGCLLGYGRGLALRGVAYRGGVVPGLLLDLGRLAVGQRQNLPGRPQRIGDRRALVLKLPSLILLSRELLSLILRLRLQRAGLTVVIDGLGPVLIGGWRPGKPPARVLARPGRRGGGRAAVLGRIVVRDDVEPAVAVVLPGSWQPRPPLGQAGWTRRASSGHRPGRMVSRELDPRYRSRRMIRMELGRRYPVIPGLPLPLLPGVWPMAVRRRVAVAHGSGPCGPGGLAVADRLGPELIVVRGRTKPRRRRLKFGHPVLRHLAASEDKRAAPGAGPGARLEIVLNPSRSAAGAAAHRGPARRPARRLGCGGTCVSPAITSRHLRRYWLLLLAELPGAGALLLCRSLPDGVIAHQ